MTADNAASTSYGVRETASSPIHGAGLIGLLLSQVALPLLAGGLIYLSWRPATLLMFQWVDAFGLTVAPLRAAVAGTAPASLVIFSLPNALWAYAVVSFFCLLWQGQPTGVARAWTAAAVVLAVGPEMAQMGGLVPGTFDVLDLATVTAAACMALLRHRPKEVSHVTQPA